MVHAKAPRVNEGDGVLKEEVEGEVAVEDAQGDVDGPFVGDFAEVDVEGDVVKGVSALVDVGGDAEEGRELAGDVGLEKEPVVESGAAGEDGEEGVFFEEVEKGAIC